jgi:hypothetical protein
MRKLLIGLSILALGTALPACSIGGHQPQNVSFNIKVTGTTSDKGDITAGKGDHITMSITTDKDEEVHLHGYDIHFDCKAGVPTVHTFDANNTGQFEYEIEATAQHLGNLTVNP